jgi:hypothetical protein
LTDVNGDGLLDITTGWEEGGITRVYVHPGYTNVTSEWPAVTVGQTPSVEDAVFCDLDGDGAFDVVTSCEGETETMFVHWAPQDPADYLSASKWKTEPFPTTRNLTDWMFASPAQLDGANGIDLAVASKNLRGQVGWLQAPENPRNLADWKLHSLYKAGWIMSVVPIDLDNDGDTDLIISDRKGETPGVLWLEHPGTDAVEGDWTKHRIGGDGREVMFLDVCDLDQDGRKDIVTAVKPDEIHWYRHPGDLASPWAKHIISVSFPEGLGSAKAVRVGDIDGNGSLDIVYSCEKAHEPKRGLVWLSYNKTPMDSEWAVHDVSGPEGVKYDRVELVDIDGDGDLDVLTCEERHEGVGIGVFWYENPLGK